jgi:hypothetical protein
MSGARYRVGNLRRNISSGASNVCQCKGMSVPEMDSTMIRII